MKNILCIFGTRPEAIKMAPLILELRKAPNHIIKICVTGQHREMLDQVLNLFQIQPDYDLNIMKKDQNLFDITSRILIELKTVIEESKPNLVLVHGDTTTAFCGSLAAFYAKVPVGHVEAGLRSNDIYSPWPEEANRLLISKLAQFHFSPTKESAENLQKEGISEKNIYITGNTGIDALHITRDLIYKNQNNERANLANLDFLNFTKKIICVTVHRRENQGQPLNDICLALLTIAKRDDVQIIFPVHPNPSIRSVIEKHLSNQNNIFLTAPLDYISFSHLLTSCYMAISDSGGIQEEAPSLGKPVLVTRLNTERPEAISTGSIKLVGSNKETIVKETIQLLDDRIHYQKMSKISKVFGDGLASKRIVIAIKQNMN